MKQSILFVDKRMKITVVSDVICNVVELRGSGRPPLSLKKEESIMASKAKIVVKECHEALDEYRWMLEDAISRGDKAEAEAIRRDMKRARNDLHAAKRKNGKERRYNDVWNEDNLALALCAF